VQATREYRRERYREMLVDWSEDDLETFAQLLEQYNKSVDGLKAANKTGTG
jgi:hypothetical protein